MKILKYNVLFLFLLMFCGCEKEAEMEEKSFPYVFTNPPKVNTEGVEFSAEIIKSGKREILQYGFVWDTEKEPSINNSSKLFNESPENKNFLFSLKNGFLEGNTYYVRACLITNQHVVYGNEKSFVSLGSLPPKVSSFMPDSGVYGTKVTILGENFSFTQGFNKVKLGDFDVEIDSISENSLVVIVPDIRQNSKKKFSLITPDTTITLKNEFHVNYPWEKNRSVSEYPY